MEKGQFFFQNESNLFDRNGSAIKENYDKYDHRINLEKFFSQK